MKLFVVLFAFLVVHEGRTSAISISEDVDIPVDTLEFILSSVLPNFDVFGDLPLYSFHEFTGTAANPETCLPYIQDAYDIAVEIRDNVDKAQQLGQKVSERLKKCTGKLNKKCFDDLLKQTTDEAKPIKDAFLKIGPKVVDIMDKFDKCMAGQTQKVNSQSNSEKCLPYVQEAYDTAVEVRRIVGQAQKLAIKLNESFQKCNAERNARTKNTCLKGLPKQAVVEGKPIIDAYMKIWPKIGELMDKFENCLA